MSEPIASAASETDQRPRDWMKRSQIEGLAALIVGGGSGMGAACARTFAANDGLVMVADLNLQNAERVRSEIQDRKSTRLNSSHRSLSRMPSSA